MLEEGKISYKQLILLIVISRISINLTYNPHFTAPPENQDVWLSELLSFPITLFLSVPIYLLWKKFPDQTIIQYTQTVAGKAGKLIGILYVWFFIHFSALSLTQFGSFLSTAVMPETPILFFAVSLILLCTYAARSGIEVISRVSEFCVPIFLIGIMTIVLFLTKDMNLKALTPILEKGTLPVLQGGFTIAARSVETLGLAMLLPYLNDRKKVKTIFLLSFALISLFFVIITISIITAYGFEEAKTRTFPFFSAIKIISVGDFLERIESVHMAIWTMGVFIKVSLYFYLAVLGLGQLFNLKDYKPLVFPIGTVFIPLSILITPSIVELREFTSYKIYTWYALFFTLFIPSLLLLTAVIRKKGEMQK